MRRIEILGHIASRFRHCSRRALLKRAVAWTAALPFFPAPLRISSAVLHPPARGAIAPGLHETG